MNNKAPKDKKSISKKFEVSSKLQDLAEKVIQEQKLDVYPSKICYLLVYPNISKTVAGRCMRTGKELKFFSQFDYLIEMSGELWDALDEKTQYILMYHELLHILPEVNEKSGDWEFRIREHDIQDFTTIIDKYGTNWISIVKNSQASMYDIDNPNDVKIN